MWKILFPWQKTGSLSLQPRCATSSLWGCGQPVRGPRPSQADPSRRPVHLSQCPLRFRVPPRGGDAALQPPCRARSGRPVTSGPNGGPRASPRPIGPGSFPRLCPAVSTPLPGLAGPQLSPLSPPGVPSTQVPPAAGSGTAENSPPFERLGCLSAPPGFSCPRPCGRPSGLPGIHRARPSCRLSPRGAIFFSSPASLSLDAPGCGMQSPPRERTLWTLRPRCPSLTPFLHQQHKSPD